MRARTVLPLRQPPAAATLQDHVAEELRAAMARRRVRQQTLAEALHIYPSTLSKRLNGEQPMTMGFVEDACRALGLNPHDLFEWQPPEPGSKLPRVDSNHQPAGYMLAA